MDLPADVQLHNELLGLKGAKGILVAVSPQGFYEIKCVFGQNTHRILLPVQNTVIIFREVFVSGLREFLGDTAGTLKVTKLAKWKTTAQMVAIGVLFGTGIFEHMYLERVVGMDRAVVQAIFEGGDDPANLRLIDMAAQVTWWVGVGLLWIAAVLTLVTGLDYFRKAIPHLRDEP